MTQAASPADGYPANTTKTPDRSARAAKDATASWINTLALTTVIAVALVLSRLERPDKRAALIIAASVILSALPGLFYLRFIQFRGPAVWNEYVYNLHRLGVDEKQNLPPRLDEAGRAERSAARSDRNIYIAKFDAHYGRRNRIRWQRGTQGPSEQATTQDGARTALRQIDAFFPVLVATLVVSIGWVIALSRPYPPNGGTLLNFLRFGFFGAYIFVVQFLIRRFFQNDLKATAYWSATERLVVVPIIVVVLYAVLGYAGPGAPSHNLLGPHLGLAFLTGVFPLVGFRTINSLVAAVGKQAIPTLEPRYPLSDLDGMSIWYEARLLEEGIEDMQSLITANIVDVMLATRIPVGRLVDWLDQAHLYLHMAPLPREGILPFAKSRRDARDGREESDRARLRRFGIRNATDLEDAFDGSANDAEYRTGLETLLVDPKGGPSITRTISNCLRREPMLAYVQNWKTKPVSLDRSSNGAPPAQGTDS